MSLAFLPYVLWDSRFCDRGTDVFLGSSNPNYQESVFAMAQHTLSGDFDELNMISAVKIMEVVLQNCSGKVGSKSANAMEYVSIC